MSAALRKDLLDSEGEAAPRSYRRTVSASAAVAALLLSACFVGYAVRKNSANVNNEIFGNHTELAGGSPKYEFDYKCYAVNGNKCLVCSGPPQKCCDGIDMKCDGGKCLCKDGCAGVDGKCWKGKENRNVKVNKVPFRITSKYWVGYDMYVPMVAPLHQMRTARWCVKFIANCGNFYFNLYKLPGGDFMGHQLYFVTFESWPDWTVSMLPTKGDDPLKLLRPPFSLYAVDMADQRDPQEIAVRVCSMKKLGFDAVKIGRTLLTGYTVWAHLRKSYFVFGWDRQSSKDSLFKETSDQQHYWYLNLPGTKTQETGIYDGLEDCEND